MNKIVDRSELRIVLNPILGPLPAEARRAARYAIERGLETSDTLSLTEGERRALLRKVGVGYVALKNEDCDLLSDLVGSAVDLISEGPNLIVVGELVGLLFQIRRNGIELSQAEGVVLNVLRKTDVEMSIDDIGDALTAVGVAMTNTEIEVCLPRLVFALNSPNNSPIILQNNNNWKAEGV